jgi:hypothetical protein
VQLEGLGKLEKLMTSSGLEPAIFRLNNYTTFKDACKNI